MVHIYTFCDKTLVGKKENKSANLLCENLYKMNFVIDEVCIYSSSFNYENLTFKNKDLFFLLMQKTSVKLNTILANISSSELTVNETLKKVVTDNYMRKNVPLEKEAENEWQIPANAVPITNPNGKTQGYLLKIADTTIFVLPNNFNEFYAIYNDCLLKYLEDNFPMEYKSETFKTFGLSEELLYKALKDKIRNKDKINISVFSKGLDNDIVIKAKQNNEKFDEYRQNIFDKLENYIYAVQQISMDEYLESLLNTKNARILLVGDASVNNIINNLSVDIIYSHICSLTLLPNIKSKINFGIPENQIKELGEQSAEIAYAMAVKALENCNYCDLVLSCLVQFEENSGVAFIALGNKLKIDVYKNRFYGSRQQILENVGQTAKFYLIKKLKAGDYKTI